MTTERIEYTDDVHVLENNEGEFDLIELLQYTKPSHDVMGKDFVFSFVDDVNISTIIHQCAISQGMDVLLVLNDSNQPRFCIRSKTEGHFESAKMATRGDEVVFWVEHQGLEQTMWLTLTTEAVNTLRQQLINALTQFNQPL